MIDFVDASKSGTKKPVETLEYRRINDRPLLLDLYLPTGFPFPFPCIIYIHGGAWRTGSRANPVCLPFIEQGYAIASIDYSLSHEVAFPAQIEDCKSAVRFLRSKASQLGIDPDHFVAWGISAGAHLAALLGATSQTSPWEGSNEISSRVHAVIDFFGPTDFLSMDSSTTITSRFPHDAPDSPESLLLGGPIQVLPELARLASPITYVSPTTVPFFIAHGTKDDIVPVQQSEALYSALKSAGVPCEMHLLPESGHGFKPSERRMIFDHVARFLSKIR